jgi:hypothetical protein
MKAKSLNFLFIVILIEFNKIFIPKYRIEMCLKLGLDEKFLKNSNFLNI